MFCMKNVVWFIDGSYALLKWTSPVARREVSTSTDEVVLYLTLVFIGDSSVPLSLKN